MKIEVNISEYSSEKGIHLNWVEGFQIDCQIKGKEVILKANQEGLISLAQHLLTLAQTEVKPGIHIHFDDNNSLEDGSCELIIEKM